ncbi:hypothetical protein B0I35DRAFT_425825 [Stachybotrys elegans]|uniref:F-box domain-containing protein n=1 Tax=Stachybotrys elegans TaxID=80388 RepID=A0A8K0SZA6_9HYPO|nr:hypothetical protein B0I35DRAFT_425825 [Stachybotrys elegans]
MMPYLLQLSNEILYTILECLSDLDQPSLFPICLVNKRLCAIAKPLLVRRWPANPNSQSANLGLFALKLLRQPALRRHVRELVISDSDREYVDLGPDERNDLAAAVPESFSILGEATNFPEQIKLGTRDAIVGLVLSWTVNLTKLDLTVPYTDNRDSEDCTALLWISEAVRQVQNQPHGVLNCSLPLSNLRWVRYREWGTGYISKARHAVPLFHLPNVKTFYHSQPYWPLQEWGQAFYEGGSPIDEVQLFMGSPNYSVASPSYGPESPIFEVQDEEELAVDGETTPVLSRERYQLGFPRGTSSIEELVIEDTNMMSADFIFFLQACRRLKSLSMSFSPTGFPQQLTSQECAEIIMQHAESLESLRFDTRHCMMINPVGGSPEPGVRLEECFQHLSRLKYLHTSIRHLYTEHCGYAGGGKDAFVKLPASIEHLKLGGDTARSPGEDFILDPERWSYRCYLVEVMEGLVCKCGADNLYPLLKTIDISDVMTEHDIGPSKALKLLAEEKGINLVLALPP